MIVQLPGLPVGVDPLIAEAKQRARRRRLFRAAGLAGVITVALVLTSALRPAGHVSSVSDAGGWVPHGVQEIDVRGPNGILNPRKVSPYISLRVTDPSKVGQIVRWFDALEQPDGRSLRRACLSALTSNVSFSFRTARGDELAKANSTAGLASPCDPIQFADGVHAPRFLLDAFTVGPGPALRSEQPADSFIGRVEQLLGVQFQRYLRYG